ncbi:MAG: hypothetical protein K0R34_2146 [Herbinix sp.]|nr:hypothetical protein [Herbinix sp.]
MIKAVRLNYQPKDGALKFEVGKEYESENGFHYCECAFNTLEFEPFENPLKTRYLEIEPLDDICDIGGNTYFSSHIKVIREVDKMELCQAEPNFKLRYDYYSELSQKAFDKIKLEMDINRKMSDMKFEAKMRRLKKMIPIALIPVILVLLYALIPLILVKMGILP